MASYLVQATLVALQVGLLQHCLTECNVVQLLIAQQLRNQIPEVVNKVWEGRLCGEAGAADANSLKHTATPQLMQHVVVLKQHGPVTEQEGMELCYMRWSADS